LAEQSLDGQTLQFEIDALGSSASKIGDYQASGQSSFAT